MEEFNISGEDGVIKVIFSDVFGFPNTTSFRGGYDLKCEIEIKSGAYNVRSFFYTATGELYEFYQQLSKCNKELSGAVSYRNYEEDLNIRISYDEIGHAIVSGRFLSYNFESFHICKNELTFEFVSDQTYISNTVMELKVIVDKYGDSQGI